MHWRGTACPEALFARNAGAPRGHRVGGGRPQALVGGVLRERARAVAEADRLSALRTSRWWTGRVLRCCSCGEGPRSSLGAIEAQGCATSGAWRNRSGAGDTARVRHCVGGTLDAALHSPACRRGVGAQDPALPTQRESRLDINVEVLRHAVAKAKNIAPALGGIACDCWAVADLSETTILAGCAVIATWLLASGRLRAQSRGALQGCRCNSATAEMLNEWLSSRTLRNRSLLARCAGHTSEDSFKGSRSRRTSWASTPIHDRSVRSAAVTQRRTP